MSLTAKPLSYFADVVRQSEESVLTIYPIQGCLIGVKHILADGPRECPGVRKAASGLVGRVHLR
jgi:hypothetical protein